MKVLLINPPQTFYPGSEQPAGNLPIGLMYIAAVLQKAGYIVEILDAFMADCAFQENDENINVGLPFDQIKQEIERRKPDIVGISAKTQNFAAARITGKLSLRGTCHAVFRSSGFIPTRFQTK